MRGYLRWLANLRFVDMNRSQICNEWFDSIYPHNAYREGRGNEEENSMKKAEITFEQLEQNNACDNKLAFKELFGEKAVITPELVRKHAAEFDWDWAARNLLPEKLCQQWAKLTRSYRTRHRADVEIADYNLRHTPSGLRRKNITEKQKAVHKATIDALHKGVKEKEAEAFARLYLSRNRVKPPKTEILIDSIMPKLDSLIREIYKSNEKDRVTDYYELGDRIQREIHQASRRVSDIFSALNAEKRRQAKERRRQQAVIRSRERVPDIFVTDDDVDVDEDPFD